MRLAIALLAMVLLCSLSVSAGPVGTPYRGPSELLGLSGGQDDEEEDTTEPSNPDQPEDNPDPNDPGTDPNQPTDPAPDSSKRVRGPTSKLDGAILWSWYWEHHKDRWIARATAPGRIAAGSAYYWFGAGAKFPPREIVPVSAKQRFQVRQALRTRLAAKKESNAGVRAEACIAVGRLGRVPVDEKNKIEGASANWVVRDLTWVLDKERDRVVRRCAILGLGIGGDPDAGTFLMRTYDELMPDEKPFALVALGLLRHLPAIDLLMDRLPDSGKHKATDEQVAAIHALGLFGPAAVPAINKEGRDGTGMLAKLVDLRGFEPTVTQAVATLGRLQEGRLVIQRAVRGSKSINIQWTSLLALSQFSTHDKDAAAAAKLLMRSAGRGKGQNRNFAIFALGEQASRLDPNSKIRRSILAYLRNEALDTKNNYIRACAAVALGMAGDRTAIPGIARLLDDSTADDYVIGAACVSLGLLRATEHADAIKEQVLTDHKWKPDARGYALLGLALMGDTTRISEIKRYASGRVPREIDRQVPLAIGVLGDRHNVSMLMRYFSKAWKSQKKHTASNAAFGLSWIKDQGAVNRLVNTATRSPDASVRAMAAIALGYVGMPERVSPLARCYQNVSYRNRFGGWAVLYTISRIL